MSRHHPETYEDFAALFPDTSGNDVNGLGELKIRRPSPFFWHPKDRHEFGELQTEVIGIQRRSPAIVEHYSQDAPRGPKTIEKSEIQIKKSADEWTSVLKTFSLSHEADLIGITPMDPLYVYDGYELNAPWVIILGVSMDHQELDKVPPSLEKPDSAVEIGPPSAGRATGVERG